MNEVDWWELETQHNDTVTRDELKTHLAAAIARAEAAEKRVAELEKEATRHHEDYDGLYQDYEEAKAKWEGTADLPRRNPSHAACAVPKTAGRQGAQ